MTETGAHPKLSNKRKRQLTEQLKRYRFFSVLERCPSREQSVAHLLQHVQTQFVDFPAFCLAVADVLALKRALFLHDCFLAWFDDLTADCRAQMRPNQLRDALWRVFLVLARRMPATDNTIMRLASVAARTDYTEAAYAFLDALDYTPLKNK